MMIRGSWSICWPLVVAVALINGCSTSKSSKLQLSDGCVVNSDCAAGLVCVFQRCHTECDTSRDCPDGALCVMSDEGVKVCRLEVESTCTAKSDCFSPLVCGADGQCRNECSSNDECVGSQVCSVQQVCAESSEVDDNNELVGAAGSSGQENGGGAAGNETTENSGSSGASAQAGSSNESGDAGQQSGGGAAGSESTENGGASGASTQGGTAGEAGHSGQQSTGGDETAGSTNVGGSGNVSGTSGTGGTTEPGTVWYVDSASPGGDGTSWDTAFATVQAALTNSLLGPGDQIWIAQGTYTPAASDGSRTTYFYLMTAVALYGGFHGTEVELADRDNPVDPSLTVLSGDLGADDDVDASGNPLNRDENTYHVVVGAPNALLDGLTISGGNANGSATEQQQGGGMYNLSCDGLRVANVRFVSNLATGNGGGLYNAAGSYTIEEIADVVFALNSAAGSGGGMFNSSGDADLRGVTFVQNSASNGNGGGMYSSGNPTLVNVAFADNKSSGGSGSGGGGMYSSGDPFLANVSFITNTAVACCNFQNSNGGGLYSSGAASLVNVTFARNTANYGGAMTSSGTPALTNCTFTSNIAASAGGGMFNQSGTISLANTVMYGDYLNSTPAEVAGTGLSFYSSYISGCGGSTGWNTSCGTDGGENIDNAASPFAVYRAPSGSWTAAPAYSADSCQTTFTNSSAPWVAGELVGLFVQPDVDSARWSPIVGNTATTLTIWGNMESAAASGTMYYLYDLRLAAGSECIDTGDNASLPDDLIDLDADGDTTEVIPWDLDNQPRVVNGTVDMGAYEYQGG